MPNPIAVHAHNSATQMFRSWFLAAALLLLWPSLLGAQDYERWYAIEMAGQPAGYMHAARSTRDDQIISSSRVVMNVARGAVAISISMEGHFVETLAGKPVSMSKVEQLGHIPTTTEYTFQAGETPGLHIRTVQAGQVSESVRPLPAGEWLTPAAAEQFVRQRLAAGAERIVVSTLEPLSGPEPNVITRTGIAPVTIELMGRSVEVFRCTAVSSSQPGIESTEYLDSNGVPVKLMTRIGPLQVSMLMTDRESALAGGAGELGPELMQRTFIRADRRIRSPRTTTRARYVLSVPEGEMPALPQTSAQLVQPLEDGGVRVMIDASALRGADEACRTERSYLESSAMLNKDDPEIARLVERAVRQAGEDPRQRAEAMRRFVYRYIRSKDLDVGFASASEVARSRQGDCTEHGVLLAAMLRADGIPARVVSGLIYADRFAGERHIFGYHMWTQALLEFEGQPTWVDLDATLPERAFDATHIALSVSALRDGEATSSLSTLLPLIGQLEVKVELAE
jgi:hypothetical protein